MSGIFVDTSAILALLNQDDKNHESAARIFTSMAQPETKLFTSSYVLVETYALLVRRFGKGAASQFRRYFEPILRVIWIDEALHNAGLTLLLASQGRRLSLVDSVSFAAMRKHRIGAAFAYDRHFENEGFEIVGA